MGSLTTLMVLVKGLPLAYNRDLQEDKPAIFDAFDTVDSCLELAELTVRRASLKADSIEKRLDEGFLDATTVMEYLIAKGVPQRSAHEVVAKLVSLCERQSARKLADLPASVLAEAHPLLVPEVQELFGARGAVNAFRSRGSTAPIRWSCGSKPGRKNLQVQRPNDTKREFISNFVL